MKSNEIIVKNFQTFFAKHKENSFKKLKEFFSEQKGSFYENKIDELMKTGLSHNDAVIKARQGWVSVIGRSLEQIVEILIQDFCKKHDFRITNDKKLKAKLLNQELEAVKRAIIVNFGEYCVLPDGDIIIYSYKDKMVRILAILSIKNSFRERYTETPYWKLKLKQSALTKHIKVFMVTPDNDDEISFKKNIKKSRIVMEYELDGIYLAKDDFDKSANVKSIYELISDLEKLK